MSVVCFDFQLYTQTQPFIQMDNPGIEHSSALTLRALTIAAGLVG